jgi:mRNA interferase RelE/StbE
MWALEFLTEAVDDLREIDFSIRKHVLKAIDKVINNPVSKELGGYGTPLGNKRGNNLSGLYKLKLRDAGIRVVYALYEKDNILTVVVVGVRSENAVYQEAYKRRLKYDI